MKSIIVLILLLASVYEVQSVGENVKILSKEYSVKSISTDGLNSVSLLTFEVVFSEPIFVSGQPIQTLSQTEKTPAFMCQFDVCYALSESTAALLGTMSLDCAGNFFSSRLQEGGWLDESSVIPIPGSSDPVVAFYNGFTFEGQEILNPSKDVSPYKLALMLMLEDQRECDPFLGCVPGSGLERRLEGVDFSNCVVELSAGQAIEPNGQVPVLSVGGKSLRDIEISGFTRKPLTCNPIALSLALDELDREITFMSGLDWMTMIASFWRAVMFSQADAILGCKEILQGSLEEVNFVGTSPTDRCIHPIETDAYEADPCCNRALRWDGCCLETDQLFSLQAFNQSSATSQLRKQCTSKSAFDRMIEDYTSSTLANSHPQTGCSANAQKLASEEIFDSFFTFADECFSQLDGGVCAQATEARDCYGGTCWSNACDPKFMTSIDAGVEMARCIADRMSETVSAIVKAQLNIPGSTLELFQETIIEEWFVENCNGFFSFHGGLTYGPPGPFSQLGFTWEIVDPEQCFADEFCLWDIVTPEGFFKSRTSCLQEIPEGYEDGICTQRVGIGANFALFLPARCVISNVSPFECVTFYGGTYDSDFDVDPCYLPHIDNEADCLQASICPAEEDPNKPATLDWAKDRCHSFMCYDSHVLREEDCVTSCTHPRSWLPDHANGRGLCVEDVPSRSDCLVRGLNWWSGRRWADKLYGTEEICHRGMCGGGGFIFLGTDGGLCKNDTRLQTCTESCPLCVSQRNSVLCFSSHDLIDECSCVESGGVWFGDFNLCAHSVFDEEECLALGEEFQWQECEKLSREECFACRAGEDCSVNQDILACLWDAKDACGDKEQCEVIGGECSDGIVQRTTGVDCNQNLPDRPFSCDQSCLVPFTFDENHFPTCRSGTFTTAIGCVDRSISDEATCTLVGGELVTKAVDEAQCTGHGTGCAEDEWLPQLSPKSESSCATCGGTTEPGFTWKDGKWQQMDDFPLYWQPMEYGPVNEYVPMLDWRQVEGAVTTAVISRLKLALQSEIMCLLNPLSSALRVIACQCTGGLDDAAADVCDTGGVDSISIGRQLLCAGTDDSAQFASLSILSHPAVVEKRYGCLQIDITKIPASQFKEKIEESLSSLSLSSAGNKEIENEYAVIRNSFDRQVGQLVGDGFGLTFSRLDALRKLTRSSHGSGSGPDQEEIIQLRNVTICMDLADGIRHTSKFGIPDFGEGANSFTPQELHVTIRTNPASGKLQYCAGIYDEGEYFPINRLKDWTKDDDNFTDTEVAFMYFVGSLYMLVFVIALLLTSLSLYLHGIVGVCINFWKAKQLSIWILFLLLIFGGLRGFYLMLVPGEYIDEDTSLAVEAILTDLPIYVFFTLYMLLIFFWAELFHYQYQRKESVLGRLKIPFVLVNLFIYVFFFIIVIVFSQSDANDQPTIEKVYKCIVAGFGFGILVGFIGYGGMLVYRTSNFASTSTGKGDNAQFRRLTFITFTCTLGSLVQFIFLLLFTFTDIEDVTTVLVYMAVVELFPAYLLVWVFFRPSRLEHTLTQSYGSSSRSVRSMPMSRRLSGKSSGSRVSSSRGSSRSPMDSTGSAHITTDSANNSA